METAYPEESESLLGPGHNNQIHYDATKRAVRNEQQTKRAHSRVRSLYWVLPVPLITSLAMAVTVATTIYAYAALACRDATNCSEKERGRYAGSLAVATSIAHFVGLFVIGPLQRLVKKDVRLALTVWTASRAISVVTVLVAVSFQSLGIALVGRIFEGAASDNSLHFLLNSVYARASSDFTSRLMGTSLALFMVGMSFGPFFGGIFDNFRISFVISGCLLLLATTYAWVLVPDIKPAPVITLTHDCADEQSDDEEEETPLSTPTGLWTLISPILPYYHKPRLLFHGMAMFLFTAVQSYLFPAIMIHATILFKFSSSETGWIVSIGAATSAFYLLVILYLLPQLSKLWQRSHRPSDSLENESEPLIENAMKSTLFDTASYIICVSVQAAAILSMTWWTAPQPFLVAVAVSALGLGAGSFLKSQLASKMKDGTQAVAVLSIMEMLGGLASPIILGSWQAVHSSDGLIFPLISGMLGVSVLMFMIGTLWI